MIELVLADFGLPLQSRLDHSLVAALRLLSVRKFEERTDVVEGFDGQAIRSAVANVGVPCGDAALTLTIDEGMSTRKERNSTSRWSAHIHLGLHVRRHTVKSLTEPKCSRMGFL